MKLKRSIYNIGFGLVSQFCILILGLIIPKLFILEYGSEINGLFSSINQLFTYVALLEAGIGAATVQALYKPITTNDKLCISQILSATKNYYRRISLYYVICVIFLAIIYPLIIKSNINRGYIMIIILLQGLSGAINFYFQATIMQLLVAEGKNYILSNINLIVYIMTSISKIILIMSSVNIIAIQAIYFIISIIQILFYYLYFKKKYSWVNLKEKPNYSVLSQKNSFLIHQISLLIFSSTDMLVLSLFCNLNVVSIYSVYNLVFTSLNNIINTLYNSISFTLGHTYHENKKKYLDLHDMCDNYYITFVFAIISVAYLLIIPFMKLYTKGIDDINYIDSYLPLLFCLVQLLTSTRVISNNLIRISGHMKLTIYRTILESTINLVVSLILVKKIGIYGVLIGTIVALIYRSTDIIQYANKKILNRKPHKVYKTICCNSLVFLVITYLNKYLKLDIKTYYDFFKSGIILTMVILPIYILVNTIINIESRKFLLNILKNGTLNLFRHKNEKVKYY